MTTKRKDVMANNKIQTMTGSSTQEKADTLMIFHAVEAARDGLNVHIYSQDTNVLLLAVRRTSLLGIHSALIIASSERRRKIFFFSPLYDTLAPEKHAALINWHAAHMM